MRVYMPGGCSDGKQLADDGGDDGRAVDGGWNNRLFWFWSSYKNARKTRRRARRNAVNGALPATHHFVCLRNGYFAGDIQFQTMEQVDGDVWPFRLCVVGTWRDLTEGSGMAMDKAFSVLSIACVSLILSPSATSCFSHFPSVTCCSPRHFLA